MRLYLVQHGIPKPESEDPQKPLSETGRKEVEAVARLLKEKGVKIKQIFHSGKLRALQTAEILGDYLSPEKGLSQAEGLNPLDPPEIWEEKLKSFNEDIMLVGHLPHLQKLCSKLVIGDAERPIFKFRQGGVVVLERDEKGTWMIIFSLHPEFVK